MQTLHLLNQLCMRRTCYKNPSKKRKSTWKWKKRTCLRQNEQNSTWLGFLNPHLKVWKALARARRKLIWENSQNQPVNHIFTITPIWIRTIYPPMDSLIQKEALSKQTHRHTHTHIHTNTQTQTHTHIHTHTISILQNRQRILGFIDVKLRKLYKLRVWTVSLIGSLSSRFSREITLTS